MGAVGAIGAMGAGAVGATGAMGAGAVGATGAMGAGKFPPRMEGCSTGMGREGAPPPPTIEDCMELVIEAPRPRELISGDCYIHKGKINMTNCQSVADTGIWSFAVLEFNGTNFLIKTPMSDLLWELDHHTNHIPYTQQLNPRCQK